MKRMHITLAAATALIASAGFVQSAMAETEGHAAEQASVLNAKVPLTQAIAAAEQAASGKASDAGLDDESDTPVWEVEVITAGAAQQVTIDMQTGAVIKIAAADDHDEDEDEGDDDGDGDDGERKDR
jgi:uncharacterized membrane protein YkoI